MTNGIIRIEERNGHQAVSARELHCFLESKKDFSSWIKDRIERYGFVQGVDFEVFTHIGENSKGGRPSIEYDIALRTGKDVWFETNVVRNQKNVLKIQNAIHEVTGMKFNEYTTKSRKRDEFFARMLFVYHCRQHKMKLTSIAKYVHRDHTSMLHLLKKYDDETRYNPNFRVLAQRVDSILNKNEKNI